MKADRYSPSPKEIEDRKIQYYQTPRSTVSFQVYDESDELQMIRQLKVHDRERG